MRSGILGIFQAAIFGILFSAVASHADQNNPALDTLFSQLHETTDVVEAASLSREIWQNWYQSDDAEITKLMQQGEMSIRQYKYVDAVRIYSEVIDLAPDYSEGWNRRATAYYLMGEYDLSTEDVVKTLNLEPRHFGALSGQGMIYIQQSRHHQALEYLERALETNPHMIGVKNNIEYVQKLIDDEVI